MKLNLQQKTTIALVLIWLFAVRPNIQQINSLPWYIQFLMFWIPIGLFAGWLIGIRKGESIKQMIGTALIVMATALLLPAYTVGLDGSIANVDVPGAEPDIFWANILMGLGISGMWLNLAVYGLMPIILIYAGLMLRRRR